MAAAMVRAIDQQAAHARRTHFPRVIFCGREGMPHQSAAHAGEQPHRATAKFPEACILYFEMSRIVLLSNETVPCTETVPST
jgi:hypothetical protein